jgi:2-polyprenyl-6-methoxyphenol hydroxylase-like FAD-dependent oxidoreductase
MVEDLLLQCSRAAQSESDILIIGAGLAGSTAAAVLGRRFRVTVVDPRPTCPPVFKAEKIEPEQAELLRDLGLFESLRLHVHRIRRIHSYYRGRLVRITPTEQYGAHYSTIVNAIRAAIPEKVAFRLGRVTNVSNSDDFQWVTVDTGETLQCRLVLLACGLNAQVLQNLQLKRVCVQKDQSLAAAFSILASDGQPFNFDALTYAIRSSHSGIDYVSLFPMERMLRANLFAFPGRDGSWLRRLVSDPNAELPRCVLALHRLLGRYQIQGPVQTSRIDLYRSHGNPQPGIVPIGDAFQNVCPSTGIGLSKIFTDVAVLSEHVSHWFEAPGMGPEKLSAFFNDPRKVAIDQKALQTAAYRRNACLAQSMRWRVHRTRLRLSLLLGKA